MGHGPYQASLSLSTLVMIEYVSDVNSIVAHRKTSFIIQ